MNRRNGISWFACNLLWVLPLALLGKPNFVIFLADDLGYGDVGYQGGDVPTPNIDSIAQGGVTLTDGYATCPVSLLRGPVS